MVDRLAAALFARDHKQLAPAKAREHFAWLPSSSKRQLVAEADAIVSEMLR